MNNNDNKNTIIEIFNSIDKNRDIFILSYIDYILSYNLLLSLQLISNTLYYIINYR